MVVINVFEHTVLLKVLFCKQNCWRRTTSKECALLDLQLASTSSFVSIVVSLKMHWLGSFIRVGGTHLISIYYRPILEQSTFATQIFASMIRHGVCTMQSSFPRFPFTYYIFGCHSNQERHVYLTEEKSSKRNIVNWKFNSKKGQNLSFQLCTII